MFPHETAQPPYNVYGGCAVNIDGGFLSTDSSRNPLPPHPRGGFRPTWQRRGRRLVAKAGIAGGVGHYSAAGMQRTLYFQFFHPDFGLLV